MKPSELVSEIEALQAVARRWMEGVEHDVFLTVEINLDARGPGGHTRATWGREYQGVDLEQLPGGEIWVPGGYPIDGGVEAFEAALFDPETVRRITRSIITGKERDIEQLQAEIDDLRERLASGEEVTP